MKKNVLLASVKNEIPGTEIITTANGEQKLAYKAGEFGDERGCMIAAYGTFSKDHMTPERAILFAEYAIKDHERELENLKHLRKKLMYNKYCMDMDGFRAFVKEVEDFCNCGAA